MRDGHLFFLLSSRPHAEFDASDAALWRKIDGDATIGYLKLTQPDAEGRLKKFRSLGVCELVPPDFPARRKRILVIEPHMDDAILSVGGLMWSLRDSCVFTLATVGGRSNFTSYYSMEREFFSVQRVSELRRAESSLVMRLLGGRHVDLAQAEAPLRYREGDWTLDWFKRHRKAIGAFIGHSESEEELETWSAAIQQIVQGAEAEEIWMPLGIGDHVDHELTRNACLRVLSRIPEVLNRSAVFLYQDVPYANRFPRHTDQNVNAITEAGGALEERLEDISESFEAKLHLLSIYGSQFKMSYMTPKVEEAAREAATDGRGRFECLYKMKRIPEIVDRLAMYSGRRAVEHLLNHFGNWYIRNRSTRRLRVLCPMPVGRWEYDFSELLRRFPNAILEIHVSERNISESMAFPSSRIEVHPVRDSSVIAWVRRIIGIAVSRPCPTILLHGEHYGAAANIAKAICFTSDTLVGLRMTHLIMALKEIEPALESC